MEVFLFQSLFYMGFSRVVNLFLSDTPNLCSNYRAVIELHFLI
jgi:hypothetical protein